MFAKRGQHYIVGRGVVKSDYIFDDTRSPDKNIRKVEWTHKGEWPHPGQAVLKTLTDITAYTDYVEMLNAIFEDEFKVDDEVKEEAELKQLKRMGTKKILPRYL